MTTALPQDALDLLKRLGVSESAYSTKGLTAPFADHRRDRGDAARDFTR